MVIEGAPRVTNSPGDGTKGEISGEIGQDSEIFFSPGFKSVAEMAGWDEEALLIASLVVEDTPEQISSKYKRRSDFLFNTPTSSGSRRKRRVKKSPVPIPVVDLDEEVTKNEENGKKVRVTKSETQEEKRVREDEKLSEQKPSSVAAVNDVVLPCIDKLREELSCAICLDICFEPSTTTCGHSFCQKCLRSSADKCGRRCPKCRQLMSNGRSWTVNTVLWNTIQLLFPQEVEARRATGAGDLSCKKTPSPRNPNSSRPRNRNPERFEREDLSRLVVTPEARGRERRRGGEGRPRQDADAALALRLQRQEFAAAFGDHPRRTASLSLARANLRAMASRAVQTQQRRRGQ
ncbi:PREDICTED: uncharacterized protein LOC104805349 [Tarenaya hassleriana]|uniref:uncharacterized protein LOC104805349 n=1 Tax=Tarenaya hassleriana TaxID=28532 RepID=UPI00053C0C9F|nr:PREDICTED: uncharacterized protein LOC104805349 [Tarenaya hassleriana]